MLRSLLRGFRHPQFVLLLAFAPVLTRAQLVLNNWSGDADWNAPLNWSLGVALNSHNAKIAGGKAHVSDTRSVGALTLSGGIIAGSGILTLAASGSIWESGTLTGAGQLQIGNGSDLTITGPGSKHLDNRTLTNAGSIVWNGGNVSTGNAAAIVNQSGATFSATSDSTLEFSLGGTRTVFSNNGTFTKSAGNGTTDLQATFNNSGAVNVNTGTLQLSGGGTSSGVVTVAQGAKLRLVSNNYAFADGSTLSGSGVIEIAGATTTFSGANTGTTNIVVSEGTATFDGTTTTSGGGTFSGGTLSGTGTVALGNAVTLSGTTLTGAGTFKANGGASITNSFSIHGTRTLELSGNSTWSAGYIYGGGGSILTNKAGATLTNTFNGTLYGTHYGSGTLQTVFNNQGTFTKSTATGITDISARLQNSGTVRVQSGTLAFTGGGTNTGTIDVASGATLAIDGSAFGLDAGTQITGQGNLRISSGVATVSSAITSAGGGDFAGGTFDGAGSLTFSGPLTLGGTSLAGTGTLATTGGAQITNHFDLKNGQALTLGGNSTWSAGNIYHGNGSVLSNTGTLTNTTSSSLYHNYGGAKLTFNNSGTFTKSNSSGTTAFDAVFNNTGTVNIQSGTLELSATGSSSGPIAIASGATLLLSESFNVTNAAQISGAGLLRLGGGTLALSGALGVDAFTIENGRLTGTQSFGRTVNWHGGDWNATATGSTTTIASGGTLVIANGGNRDFNYRAIENAVGGNVYWDSGYLRSGNGGSFVNRGTFHDRNASGYSVYNPGAGNGFGGTFTFTNHGTYTRSVGSTTSFEVPFINSGTVNLDAGEIRLQGGGTMGATGIVNAASGSRLSFAGDYTLADGAQLLGAGTFVQETGTLTIDGTLKASRFNWDGGNWNAATAGATTFIGSGTTLVLANGGNKDFDRRNITVSSGGNVTWNSGHLRAGNGSVFTNDGTFLDRNGSSYSVYNPSFGGTFAFVNNASYTRDVGGTTYFDAPFHNHGTVTLAGGNIELGGGGTMSATSVVTTATGTHLYFTNNYTLAHGAQFTGSGAVVHVGGSLAIDGALKAASFDWSGGDWNAASSSLTSIASGTVLNINNGGNRDFNRRSITVDAGGTVNWHSGHLRSGNGGVFANYGTFHDQNSSNYSIYNAADSGFGGTFSFVNHGLYLRDVGGRTYFEAPFDNHGTLTLADGSIEIMGGGTMSATSIVNASSGTNLYISGNYAILDGARFTGGGGIWLVGGNLSVDVLRADNFHWNAGTWNSATPSTTTIAAGTTLNLTSGNHKDFAGRAIVNQGVVNWHEGYLRGGNGSSFTNAASATFNDANSNGYSIYNPFGGTFSFVNHGLYLKTTNATTEVDVPFTNTGTLAILGGTLNFNATFHNTGAIQLASAAVARFPGAISINTSVSGTGTLHSSAVTAGGVLAPGNPTGTLAISGGLTLLSTSTLLIELGGANQGSGYDFLSVGGSAALDGTLSLSFLNNFQSGIQPADTFAILSSAGLTGAFANVANGGFLVTTDGLGMFRVNYGANSAFPALANSVVLSNFQAIPEPSTYVMLGLGALAVVWTVRRRRR